MEKVNGSPPAAASLSTSENAPKKMTDIAGNFPHDVIHHILEFLHSDASVNRCSEVTRNWCTGVYRFAISQKRSTILAIRGLLDETSQQYQIFCLNKILSSDIFTKDTDLYSASKIAMIEKQVYNVLSTINFEARAQFLERLETSLPDNFPKRAKEIKNLSSLKGSDEILMQNLIQGTKYEEEFNEANRTSDFFDKNALFYKIVEKMLSDKEIGYVICLERLIAKEKEKIKTLVAISDYLLGIDLNDQSFTFIQMIPHPHDRDTYIHRYIYAIVTVKNRDSKFEGEEGDKKLHILLEFMRSKIDMITQQSRKINTMGIIFLKLIEHKKFKQCISLAKTIPNIEEKDSQLLYYLGEMVDEEKNTETPNFSEIRDLSNLVTDPDRRNSFLRRITEASS